MDSWIHNFKPVGRIENKLWQNEHSSRPELCKITRSTRKALYRLWSITVKIRNQKTKVLHVGFSAIHIVNCSAKTCICIIINGVLRCHLGMFITIHPTFIVP